VQCNDRVLRRAITEGRVGLYYILGHFIG